MAQDNTPPKRDDLNSYLTWPNVIKVVIFLCTPIALISSWRNEDTSRDYDIRELKNSVQRIEVNMNNNNAKNEETNTKLLNELNEVKRLNSKLEYEVLLMKELNKHKR